MLKYQKRKTPIEMIIANKQEFSKESSLIRISEIDNLPEMPKNISEIEKRIFFSSLFDFDSNLMIQTVGGLLSYTDKNKIGFDFDLNTLQTPIHSISKINLNKILMLDSNAFKSLDIFKAVDLNCASRQHDLRKSTSFRTNLYDNSTDTLYGLYSSKILTKIGIRKLRSIMLKPVRDMEVLHERHKLIEFFLKKENSELTKSLKMYLKKCKYINTILIDMRIAKCSLAEWKR